MGGKVAFILLHLLLLKMEAASSENPFIKMVTQKEDNSEKIHSNMADQKHHMGHMNPSHMIFFTTNDLKLGKKLKFYMPTKDPSASPPSLPKEIADSIPFSLKQLPQILNFFSFPPGSPQAQAVENTLHECGLKPIKGETKFCGTSMESMANSASSAFGLASKSSIKHLYTTHLTKSHPHHLQNYTLLQMPLEIEVPKFFACHSLSYPYAVHYCHYQEGDNKVLQLLLEGDDGDRVVALAVCHMDTSDWTPNHPSFHVLKGKPGMMPVCHIFPQGDLVWIPMST